MMRINAGEKNMKKTKRRRIRGKLMKNKTYRFQKDGCQQKKEKNNRQKLKIYRRN